jgi:AraC-like DNA-binding protein
MDLITDLPPSKCHDGNTYDSIVTFVCMLTKQAHFVRANKSITSAQLAHVFLDHVFSKHGLPQLIVSDRDTRITSEFWTTLFQSLGSKLNLSSAHHPQTDGQTENAHRTIEQILRAYVSPLHDDWTKWLSIAEFAYNSHVHSSTLTSPFYANYGFNPSAPPSLVTNPGNAAAAQYLENIRDIQAAIFRELDLAKARQAEQADRHRREIIFKIGDRVRLSSDFISLAEYPSSKLRPRFLGPFTIDKIISPVSYRLEFIPSSTSPASSLGLTTQIWTSRIALGRISPSETPETTFRVMPTSSTASWTARWTSTLPAVPAPRLLPSSLESSGCLLGTSLRTTLGSPFGI